MARGSKVAAGALVLLVGVSLAAPTGILAAEPAAAVAPAPVFVCTIAHATQSGALGVFATSLTVWTRVSDAPPDHVAAVLWLEPPVIGAMSGLAMARSAAVVQASTLAVAAP